MQVVCPECDKKLKIANRAAPFKVRCPACEHIIHVTEDDPDAAVIAKAPAKRRAPPPDDDDMLDGDEQEDSDFDIKKDSGFDAKKAKKEQARAREAASGKLRLAALMTLAAALCFAANIAFNMYSMYSHSRTINLERPIVHADILTSIALGSVILGFVFLLLLGSAVSMFFARRRALIIVGIVLECLIVVYLVWGAFMNYQITMAALGPVPKTGFVTIIWNVVTSLLSLAVALITIRTLLDKDVRQAS